MIMTTLFVMTIDMAISISMINTMTILRMCISMCAGVDSNRYA